MERLGNTGKARCRREFVRLRIIQVSCRGEGVMIPSATTGRASDGSAMNLKFDSLRSARATPACSFRERSFRQPSRCRSKFCYADLAQTKFRASPALFFELPRRR